MQGYGHQEASLAIGEPQVRKRVDAFVEGHDTQSR
jgi:hypothetical protein